MDSLRSLVASQPLTTEELPLIHASRGELLSSIAKTHALEPQRCEVFSESIVYLFYGRPAYRSNRGTHGGELTGLCPVVFVFRPRAISRFVHRVHPCDTGAVAGNRFVPHILPSDLADLALAPEISSARQLVSLFFDSNENYFLGKAIAGKSFANGSVAARFYDLLMQPGPVNCDDRKSAIEIQAKRAIPLKGRLLFVALPRELLENKEINDTIKFTWACDPLPYATYQGSPPAEYFAAIRQKVMERFKEATRI